MTPSQTSGRGPQAFSTSPVVPCTMLPQLKGPAMSITGADLVEADLLGAESIAGDPASPLAGHVASKK